MKCMKRNILMYSLVAASLIMTSCSEISMKDSSIPDEQNAVLANADSYLTRTFAQPDGSKKLNGTPAENLKALLEAAGSDIITSFNPSQPLSESVTEIYLGENITTLGESYDMTLTTRNYGNNIRAIHVDEKNPMLYAHKGIVYKKNGDEKQLYYIPGGMEYIELLPMKLVDKNTIYNHANVTEICFPEGTEEVSAYAIENCPKLKRVYVPKGAKVSDAALYNCPKDVEIVYGIPSGIKHVTI